MRRYLSSTFRALSSRDFRLFAGGQAISASGVWMQRLAQAWLILMLTDSGFMLGLIAALQLLPTLLLTPVGGALADRFDRRQILIATNLCGMLPALALGAVVWLDVAHWWMVMAAALVQGLVDALDRPARMTLVNDIVGPGMLANAVTLNSVIQQGGKLVGPAVAGILIGAVGISAAFFANAASYLPVVIGLLLIRPAHADQAPRSGQTGLSDTLHYVAGRRELAIALGLAGIVGFFCLNFQVLMPLLFRDVLGGEAEAVGLALTCMGLGGVVGGLVVAGGVKAGAKSQAASVGALGATLMGVASAPTLEFGYAASFVAGAASVTFAATSGAHIQLAADRHMRGRMMGLYVLALGGSSAIGGPMQGGIAELTNARVPFVIASCATLIACLVACRLGFIADQATSSTSGLAANESRETMHAVESPPLRIRYDGREPRGFTDPRVVRDDDPAPP